MSIAGKYYVTNILNKLGIRYLWKESFFILPNEEMIISINHEDTESFMNQNEKILKDYKAITYDTEQEQFLTEENEEPVSVFQCSECGKYYLSSSNAISDKKCCNCGNDNVRFRTKKMLPAWTGKEEFMLFDIDEADRHLADFEGDARTKKKMEELIFKKLAGKPESLNIDKQRIKKISELKKIYPNMEKVTDYLLENFELCKLRQTDEISFKPLLLVGGPGCGKSSYTAEVCKILMGKPAMKIDLGNSVANFTLTGSDPAYKNGCLGKIVESMLDRDMRPIVNPIIHFDELDKINNSQDYNVMPVFYGLLEKSNSRRFFENYLGINVDVSHMNFIFTANSVDTIPAPILNRLKIFMIQDYTHEQLKNAVLDNFYAKWLSFNKMRYECLPKRLSLEIKEMILAESKDDPRSIEDAIDTIAYKTMRQEPKKNKSVALFSADELYNGWKNYRGVKKRTCSSKEM